MDVREDLPNSLEKLLVLERRVEREWWWLNGALNAIAQMKAEGAAGNVSSFREMQAQLRVVDRQRVEIALRIAELEVAQQVAVGNCQSASMAPHQLEEGTEASWPKQSEPARSE